jgi:hypothetical protein
MLASFDGSTPSIRQEKSFRLNARVQMNVIFIKMINLFKKIKEVLPMKEICSALIILIISFSLYIQVGGRVT